MDLELSELLTKAILNLTKSNQTESVLIGEVLSIDEETETCVVKPLDSEAEIYGVRLRGITEDKGKGFLIIPKINSTVILGMIDSNNAFVSDYSDIEKFFIHTEEGQKIEVKDKIKFNNGDLGGMVKVITLTQKLNNLENKLNEIIQLLKTHTHASNGAISLELQSLSNVIQTNRSEIENENIIH